MFMNPRAGWDMEEMARLVAAFRSPTLSSHIYLILADQWSETIKPNTFIGCSDTLMEGSALLWLAGTESKTQWTTRCPPSTPLHCLSYLFTFDSFTLFAIAISSRFRPLRTSMQLCMGMRRRQRRTPTRRQWKRLRPTAERFNIPLSMDILITCSCR